jgi:hypothetical protein
MAELDLKSIALIVIAVVFILLILLMVLRIMFKVKKGPSDKKKRKAKVLKAVPTDSDSESDSIFNTIISTKRIANDLRRRGIDTSNPDELIKSAESEYNMGRENNAKYKIKDAKTILLNLKKSWDEKTGFDVVPNSPDSMPKKAFKQSADLSQTSNIGSDEHLEPEKEFPELKKAVDKKPDNYLPSKFTISLAGRALDDANGAGQDTQQAQVFLVNAKECFDREDYDEAFRLALSCKKEAEALLGVVKDGGGAKEGISDLAAISSDSEDLKICTICGNKKIAYICIEGKGGEEATCKDCYDRTMRESIAPPPPPPPPDESKAFLGDKKEKEEPKEQHFCPNCGAKVTAEDVFCGICGKPVKEELKCVGCGTKVEPGDMFCRKCGARLVT